MCASSKDTVGMLACLIETHYDITSILKAGKSLEIYDELYILKFEYRILNSSQQLPLNYYTSKEGCHLF